jgi:hypothetical protein
MEFYFRTKFKRNNFFLIYPYPFYALHNKIILCYQYFKLNITMTFFLNFSGQYYMKFIKLLNIL